MPRGHPPPHKGVGGISVTEIYLFLPTQSAMHPASCYRVSGWTIIPGSKQTLRKAPWSRTSGGIHLQNHLRHPYSPFSFALGFLGSFDRNSWLA